MKRKRGRSGFARRNAAMMSGGARPTRYLVTVLPLLAAAGCGHPFQVRATDYHLDVRLDPIEHSLVGHVRMTLEPLADRPVPDRAPYIAIDLHRDLEITDVTVEGAVLRRRSTRSGRHARKSDDGPITHRTHLLE